MTSNPCSLGSDGFDKPRRHVGPPGRFIEGTRPGLPARTIGFWVRGAARDGSGGEVTSVLLGRQGGHDGARATRNAARRWRDTLWERRADDVQRARDRIRERVQRGALAREEAEALLAQVDEN